MKIKLILVILLLGLLVFQADAQRGRSRSRSRSRSSFFGKSNTANPNLDIPIWFYLIGAGVVGLLGLCICSTKTDRLQQVGSVMSSFQNLNSDAVELSEEEIQKSLDWFKKTFWKVRFNSKSSKSKQKWRMIVNSISKKIGTVYDFYAEGYKDQYGHSRISGIFILNKGGMSICFQKRYTEENKKGKKAKHRQSNDDVLVYEGHSNGKGFKGSWYYKGYTHDNKLCGFMSITPFQENKKGFKDFTDEWEHNKKVQNQSTLTEDQKADTINKFQSYIWKILSKNLQGSIFKMWEMKISKISKREDSIYDFKGSGVEDQTETSQILGVIMFTQAGISFLFDKVYSKNKRQRQEGDDQLMIHEVRQNEKGYKGTWYLQGYQGDNHNSGEIEMTSRQE